MLKLEQIVAKRIQTGQHERVPGQTEFVATLEPIISCARNLRCKR